jgi:hypothetical protein
MAAQRCADYVKTNGYYNVQVRAAYGASADVTLAWLNAKAIGRRGDGQPTFGFTDDVPRQHARVNVPRATPVAVCYLHKDNGWPVPSYPGAPPMTLAQIILGPPGTTPLFAFYAGEGGLALDRPS